MTYHKVTALGNPTHDRLPAIMAPLEQNNKELHATLRCYCADLYPGDSIVVIRRRPSRRKSGCAGGLLAKRRSKRARMGDQVSRHPRPRQPAGIHAALKRAAASRRLALR